MGFKDFDFLNSAMLAKQAWRVICNLDALWVRILKMLYPNEEFMQAKRKRGESLVWRSILHGRDMLVKYGGWLIGDGRSVDILNDNWLPGGRKLGGSGILVLKEYVILSIAPIRVGIWTSSEDALIQILL